MEWKARIQLFVWVQAFGREGKGCWRYTKLLCYFYKFPWLQIGKVIFHMEKSVTSVVIELVWLV
jgi:hypothetical protein